MSLEHLPTPETDAAERIIPSRLTPDEFNQNHGEWVPSDHARDLERRLTVASEALAKVLNSCLTMEQAENIAEKALTLTAPKP